MLRILAGGQEPKVGSFLSFVGQALALWFGTLPAGQLITALLNLPQGSGGPACQDLGFTRSFQALRTMCFLPLPSFLPPSPSLSLFFLIFYIIFFIFSFSFIDSIHTLHYISLRCTA